FLATVIFTAVLFSGSRGGMIGAIVLLLLSIGYTLIQAWRWNRLRESSMVSSVFLGLLVLFASVFIAVAGPERVFDRLQNLVEDKGGTSVDHRILASRATAEMFKDEWLFGWGAGSFEFAFPKYQQEYPEIHYI